MNRKTQNEVKYKLQEAGMGVTLFGAVGLVVYSSVQNPAMAPVLVIVGLVIFMVGKMMR